MCRITREITDEMTKKRIKRRERLSKYLQQLVEQWSLARDSKTLIRGKHQEREREIRLVGKSINTLKLSSILPHINTIKYFWQVLKNN